MLSADDQPILVAVKTFQSSPAGDGCLPLCCCPEDWAIVAGRSANSVRNLDDSALGCVLFLLLSNDSIKKILTNNTKHNFVLDKDLSM